MRGACGQHMADDVHCKVTITRSGENATLKLLAQAVPELEGVSFTLSESLLEITIISDDVGDIRALGDKVLAALGQTEDDLSIED
jgi:hypothetical protein